jgi:hypothetical protein
LVVFVYAFGTLASECQRRRGKMSLELDAVSSSDGAFSFRPNTILATCVLNPHPITQAINSDNISVSMVCLHSAESVVCRLKRYQASTASRYVAQSL